MSAALYSLTKNVAASRLHRNLSYIGPMIIGSGLDLVDVPRFERFCRRFHTRGLDRLFTAGEQDYCRALANPVPSLAARFAAKEAFLKATGAGFGRGGTWKDIEVVRLESGRPMLCLHGRAARVAHELGVHRIHLSISHTAEMAAATVILEG